MGQTVIDSKLRHEWKHHITESDKAAVIARLSVIASHDEHYGDKPYKIRSLYFDNCYDKALSERMNGQEVREKFRIRMYNGDDRFIRLEKKEKYRDLCGKKSCRVTKEQVKRLIDGDYSWLMETGAPLCEELYAKMQAQLLRPRVIVDYTRKAFTYEPGNVRITFDYDVRTGLDSIRMFDDVVTIPSDFTHPVIMEVKYDAFFPTVILDAVQLDGRRTTSFSKYASCRLTNF